MSDTLYPYPSIQDRIERDKSTQPTGWEAYEARRQAEAPDPVQVDGLQSVTVTFAIDAPNYEAAVAQFTQFLDDTDEMENDHGVLAAVVELLPQPGDCGGVRDEQCMGVI